MRSRALGDLVNIEDFERAARRRLPKPIFDSIAGGAGDESTVRRNRDDFGAWALVPRALRDVRIRDLQTSVLGEQISAPIVVGPAGFQRMCHRDAELASIRGAHKADTAFVLATASSYSLEDVASESSGVRWFQLYPDADRERTGALLGRVEAAGFTAVCVTIDTSMFGIRERDKRNKLTIPFKLRPRVAAGCATRPAWTFDYLRGGVGRIQSNRKFPASAKQAGQVLARHKVTVTEDYFRWIRDQWPGKLIVKGVLRADDCDRLIDHGVDAMVVSNHGGRQLESEPSTISQLPSIVEAVDDRVEVFLDGGVRRGTDVLKAVALGARATWIGRPFLYGLTVAGDAGVARVVELLKAELETAMGLLGCPSVQDLSPEYLIPAHEGRPLPAASTPPTPRMNTTRSA